MVIHTIYKKLELSHQRNQVQDIVKYNTILNNTLYIEPFV